MMWRSYNIFMEFLLLSVKFQSLKDLSRAGNKQEQEELVEQYMIKVQKIKFEGHLRGSVR